MKKEAKKNLKNVNKSKEKRKNGEKKKKTNKQTKTNKQRENGKRFSMIFFFLTTSAASVPAVLFNINIEVIITEAVTYNAIVTGIMLPTAPVKPNLV